MTEGKCDECGEVSEIYVYMDYRKSLCQDCYEEYQNCDAEYKEAAWHVCL